MPHVSTCTLLFETHDITQSLYLKKKHWRLEALYNCSDTPISDLDNVSRYFAAPDWSGPRVKDDMLVKASYDGMTVAEANI